VIHLADTAVQERCALAMALGKTSAQEKFASSVIRPCGDIFAVMAIG